MVIIKWVNNTTFDQYVVVLVPERNEGEHGYGWGQVSSTKTRRHQEGNETAKPGLFINLLFEKDCSYDSCAHFKGTQD